MHLHCRNLAGLILLTACTAAPCQTPPPPASAEGAPDADVATLNRRIAERNATIERGNAERQAAWEQERDRIAAENARLKAAFSAQLSAHDADMARWQAQTAGLANAPQPQSVTPMRQTRPSPEAKIATGEPRRTCRMEPMTGSLTQRIRVCSTAGERAEANRNVRRNWGGAAVSGCGSASCGP